MASPALRELMLRHPSFFNAPPKGNDCSILILGLIAGVMFMLAFQQPGFRSRCVMMGNRLLGSVRSKLGGREGLANKWPALMHFLPQENDGTINPPRPGAPLNALAFPARPKQGLGKAQTASNWSLPGFLKQGNRPAVSTNKITNADGTATATQDMNFRPIQ